VISGGRPPFDRVLGVIAPRSTGSRSVGASAICVAGERGSVHGPKGSSDSEKFELSIDFDYWKEMSAQLAREGVARRRRLQQRQNFCPTTLCNFPSRDLLHARVVANLSLFQCVMWLTNREPQLSKPLPSELGSRKAALPRIERSGKHPEETITQVWFPERKIDIKIYVARRGQIAREAPRPEALP
jgi:hypothetical protein